MVNGVVPEAYAAQVGNLIADPAEQAAAMELLARSHPANADQARMMVTDIRDSGFLRGDQTNLFGNAAFAQSLVPERARVLDTALRTLRRNKNVFRAAVEGEDTLAGAGNRLDRENNVKARTDNEQLIDWLEHNATTRGAVSDALTAAARDLADGKPIPAVVSQFLAHARQTVGRETGAVAPDRGADGGDGHAEPGETGPVVGQDRPPPPPSSPTIPANPEPETVKPSTASPPPAPATPEVRPPEQPGPAAGPASQESTSPSAAAADRPADYGANNKVFTAEAAAAARAATRQTGGHTQHRVRPGTDARWADARGVSY